MSNFYLKSKRSVNKWSNEGPAAWVVPGDDPRPVGAAKLMDLLQIQGVEVQKTTADAEVTQKSGKVKIPAGSYVVRMDQPYQPHGGHAARHAVLQRQRSGSVRRYGVDAGRAAQREDDPGDGHVDFEGADDDGGGTGEVRGVGDGRGTQRRI